MPYAILAKGKLKGKVQQFSNQNNYNGDGDKPPEAMVHHTKSWLKTAFSCSPLTSKEMKRKFAVFTGGRELFQIEVKAFLSCLFLVFKLAYPIPTAII